MAVGTPTIAAVVGTPTIGCDETNVHGVSVAGADRSRLDGGAGAICTSPGRIDRSPTEGIQEEIDRLLDDYFGSLSLGPPNDLDGDGVLDCWRGLTSN